MKRAFAAGVIATLGVVSAVWFAAMASPPTGRDLWPGAAALTGSVSLEKTLHNDRIALPGMALVHVELIDVSGKGPRGAVLGEETIWLAGGRLPVDFRIAYDPSRIDPTHAYMVRARIMEGERVLYLNTTPYYVLTRGAPGKVEIIVVPAQVRIR